MREGRILLTHDVCTMPRMFAISLQVSFGSAVAEPLNVAGASDADEWANQVNYLP